MPSLNSFSNLDLLKIQDDNLDLLDVAISGLHCTATTINDEIRVQNRLLDSLEIDVNNGNDKIKNVNISVVSLLVSITNDNQYCTILILAIILIIIIALVIWT